MGPLISLQQSKLVLLQLELLLEGGELSLQLNFGTFRGSGSFSSLLLLIFHSPKQSALSSQLVVQI